MAQDNQAYKVLQDTSLPKALYLIREDEIQGKVYETEGRSYDAGSYVLRSDITPTLLESIDNGDFDAILEPVPLEEAEAALTLNERMIHAPEHSVEAEAMGRYGHKLIDRDTVTELRSAGSEDAAAAQAEAYADGADERPGLTFETAADPGSDEGVGSRVKDVEYVDAETAADAGAQLTASGVMATNPFAEKAKAKSTRTKKKATTSNDDSGSGSAS